MSAPVVECHRCGTPTGEDPAEVGEHVTYCPPCRSVMVLPCDCGSYYGPTYSAPMTGAAVRKCPDCGTICAYWEDDDLTEPPEPPDPPDPEPSLGPECAGTEAEDVMPDALAPPPES